MTITGFDDTYIWDLNTMADFSSAATLEMETSDNVKYGLIKATNISAGVPAGSVITAANLYLFTSSNSPGTVAGYRMVTTWDESSNWDTFGGDGLVIGDETEATESFSDTNPTDDMYIVFDVTADVQFWRDGGLNEGWALTNDDSESWGVAS